MQIQLRNREQKVLESMTIKQRNKKKNEPFSMNINKDEASKQTNKKQHRIEQC